MNTLPGHIETRIGERRLFREGQRVLVAVSGGVDSMVLLDLLQRLASKHRWKLTVAHFNHQLRGTKSDGDEKLVRRIAQKLRLPVVVDRGDVRGLARASGLSLEMAARKLRHEFLARAAVKAKIPTIALAHHADDQIELFFLRLLRGAGGEGLAGMKWSGASPVSSKIRLARPLLDVPKTDLREYARENKIVFREDASNASLDMQRNRIRHELIPLLTQRYQPALGRAVTRLMDLVGAEADFVAQAARGWLEGADRPDFGQLPVALQRRVIHMQLTQQKVPPDFDLIERLRLGPGQYFDVHPGCSVFRDQTGRVQLREVKGVQFDARRRELSLSGKKREVTFAGLRIRWEYADDNGITNACREGHIEYFDAQKVGTPICLRYWQPGDRFQPIGTRSASKLQDLFTNLKVPREERRRRVVATTGSGELFWVEGLRMAEKFKLDESTTRKLQWSWSRE